MKPEQFTHVFKLSFAEASQFFRDKLNIPTAAWDDMIGAAHAKGFASAGAYNAELLAELRTMTDKAIAGGMDIREFRKQFRDLVGRYGWQLKGGGTAWRADLIWRTNMRTAYQAGRWQQFREGGIEYLRYVHNDGVQHPRHNHVAMDGMILPIDDPFWSANYPPNGWGCKCRAVAVRTEDYDAAPEDLKTRPENWRDLADGGWNYNVGEAGEEMGYQALSSKFESLPNDIAGAWLSRWLQEPAFARFYEGRIKGEFPVAIVKEGDMTALKIGQQAVWISDDVVAALPGISLEDLRQMQQVIDQGEVFGRGSEKIYLLRKDGRLYRVITSGSSERNAVTHFEIITEDADIKAVPDSFSRMR